MIRLACTELPSAHGIIFIELTQQDDEYVLILSMTEDPYPTTLRSTDRELMVARYLRTVAWARALHDGGVL